MLLVCNTQHTGRAMRAAPDARIDDGLLDAIVVPRIARLRLLPLLARLQNGSHALSPLVRARRIRSFVIRHQAASAVVIDGEIVEAEVIEGTVLPGALQLIG
jgi:diacylglycerol kinase (ATP)